MHEMRHIKILKLNKNIFIYLFFASFKSWTVDNRVFVWNVINSDDWQKKTGDFPLSHFQMVVGLINARFKANVYKSTI